MLHDHTDHEVTLSPFEYVPEENEQAIPSNKRLSLKMFFLDHDRLYRYLSYY